MDHSCSLLVVDDTDLERFSIRGRPDVHGDGRIVGLECSPVVAECVEHVAVANIVLAGARLDVDHLEMLPGSDPSVNRC